MRWIRAVVLAFSTYTRIPMPQGKWDEDAMKLCIAFLPLVGVVIGCAVWVLQILCHALGFSAVLFAAFAVVIPILITGGIHMDGYCDTSDALASWQDKERRLEILKDPRVGAFALIRFVVYILVCFALFYELYTREIIVGIGLLYPLSRCFTVWSAMTMPNARKDGMLAAFAEKAGHHQAVVVLTVLSVLAAAGWVWATFPQGLAGLVLCLPVTLWYRSMTMKRFGGVTGDTTGYYLQTLELTFLAGLLIGGVIAAWL